MINFFTSENNGESVGIVSDVVGEESFMGQ